MIHAPRAMFLLCNGIQKISLSRECYGSPVFTFIIFSSHQSTSIVSKTCVPNTTAKDNIMPTFLPLLLLFAGFIGALWFHDVWYPPEGRANKKKPKLLP